MPLLRMDPGVLYQKYIGESEARLREALHQAEWMAPVVLWIDEIFFVDLPGPQEREAIFSVHLKKRRRDKAQYDLPALVAGSEGFTGAEIEQAVIAGLYAAFAQKAECTTEHILAAMRATQPLSVVMRESVEQLRAWANGRCVMAD